MTLSDAALAAKVAHQAEVVAAWQTKATDRIGRALDDAEAHALKALTATLKAAPDGRAALAKARRNPSFVAAQARLDELAGDLALMVKDARSDFYVDSFDFWAAHLPADVHRSVDPAPRQADVARAVNAVLHGMTIEKWFAGCLVPAKRSLEAKVAQAGSRATASADGRDLLQAWRAQTGRQFAAASRAALVDSATFSDRAAGRDVVHPDLLHPDPTFPSH